MISFSGGEAAGVETETGPVSFGVPLLSKGYLPSGEEAADRWTDVEKGGSGCGAKGEDGSSFLSGGARLVMQIFVMIGFSWRQGSKTISSEIASRGGSNVTGRTAAEVGDEC